MEKNYKADNCKSQSEFIEKAICFYLGYVHAQNALDYLPPVLSDILTGIMGNFADRMGKLLFKQAVECNITNHIIAADTDIDISTYEKLRGRSVQEVRQTNGKISFEDDLIFQRSV